MRVQPLLERMDRDLVKAILAENPAKIITLDRLFEGNDPLKTNIRSPRVSYPITLDMHPGYKMGRDIYPDG